MTAPWERDWSSQSPAPADDAPGYVRAYAAGQAAAAAAEAPKPWHRDWGDASSPGSDATSPSSKAAGSSVDFSNGALNVRIDPSTVWGRIALGAGNRISGMAAGADRLIGAGADAIGLDGLGRSAAARAATLEARAQAPIPGATTWEDVKAAPSIGKVGRFALEQGLASTPDMVLAVGALPAYVGLRTGEIGQERATNNGEQQAGFGDFARALPAAAASALLERFGTEGILAAPAKGIISGAAKAGAREGITEFGQSVAE